MHHTVSYPGELSTPVIVLVVAHYDTNVIVLLWLHGKTGYVLN